MTLQTDLTGHRHGHLTAVRFHRGSRQRQGTWECLCDCGETRHLSVAKFRRNKSCGCERPAHVSAAQRGVWDTETPTYPTAHQRVYSAKGQAAEHACPCGEQAAQWAYDGLDPDEFETRVSFKGVERIVKYSGDPKHYRALCISCHVKQDRYGKEVVS
ncbi:MAG: hypothetical protein QM711_06075 [Micropruina sp.]|uniref:hypothetical protein n=1 Tax=Micropruina sp. TaxID=2737536 RepID=UPI0039E6F513